MEMRNAAPGKGGANRDHRGNDDSSQCRRSPQGKFGEKFQRKWVIQVSSDHRVTDEAARLAAILAFSFLNRETGLAWPGMARLSEELGWTGKKKAQRAVRCLADRGHLEVTEGGGRARGSSADGRFVGATNCYRPLLHDGGKGAGSDPVMKAVKGVDVKPRIGLAKGVSFDPRTVVPSTNIGSRGRHSSFGRSSWAA